MVGIEEIFQWVVKNALKSAPKPTEMQLNLLSLYAKKTKSKISMYCIYYYSYKTTWCTPKLPRLPRFSPVSRYANENPTFSRLVCSTYALLLSPCAVISCTFEKQTRAHIMQ